MKPSALPVLSVTALLAGCATDVHLDALLADRRCQISPSPLRLERGGEACTQHTITLVGNCDVIDILWDASLDQRQAIQPESVELHVDGTADLTLDFCPPDAEPVFGVLWFHLDPDAYLPLTATEQDL